MDNSVDPKLLISNRLEFAPLILAALLQRHHMGNDDKLVAQVVSLSDKLTRAIIEQ